MLEIKLSHGRVLYSMICVISFPICVHVCTCYIQLVFFFFGFHEKNLTKYTCFIYVTRYEILALAKHAIKHIERSMDE